MELEKATLADLKRDRPDLVTEIEAPHVEVAEGLKEELAAAKGREAFTAKVDALLAEAKMPEGAVTPVFREMLVKTGSEDAAKALIADRKVLAEASRKAGNPPKSGEGDPIKEGHGGGSAKAPECTVESLSEALTGR